MPYFPSPVLEVDMTQITTIRFLRCCSRKKRFEGYSCNKGIVKQQGKVYIQCKTKFMKPL